MLKYNFENSDLETFTYVNIIPHSTKLDITFNHQIAMQHGSNIDPANKFLKVQQIPDFEHFEWDPEYVDSFYQRDITYIADTSRSIISENDSPDIPFRFSLNPYRGCAHGCAYCYARNTHEYLGLNAGLDFETKIYVKEQAPELFQEFLSRRNYQPELIAFSGVTDCYQPAERKFELTRQCLQVALDFKQPIGIVTKNALVVRDLDLLSELAKQQLAQVNVSITTLDPELARVMEPRTSIPAARLRAIKLLSEAGIPTRVMVAPIIPGINDHEVPSILAAAKEAGATDARYILLRLPLTVEPVFLEWLKRTQPTKATKVESLIRQTRAGKLYSSDWSQRMKGTGLIAEHIKNIFKLYHQKLSFIDLPTQTTEIFKVPQRETQRLLFE